MTRIYPQFTFFFDRQAAAPQSLSTICFDLFYFDISTLNIYRYTMNFRAHDYIPSI